MQHLQIGNSEGGTELGRRERETETEGSSEKEGGETEWTGGVGEGMMPCMSHIWTSEESSSLQVELEVICISPLSCC